MTKLNMEIGEIKFAKNKVIQFENGLMNEYFENFKAKLIENKIQVFLLDQNEIQLIGPKKNVFIRFDSENGHYIVKTILNKYEISKDSNYFANLLNLKSLKACLSYSYCHLNIKK